MKISLISISSPITEEQLAQLEKSLEYLHSLGLEPVYSDEIFSLEKRSATQRVQEFTDAYLNKETSLILSVRGGAGCIELLEHLDYEKILKANPKPILAYSDLTTLALAFNRKASDLNLEPIPFYHSPMLFEMASWFDEAERISEASSVNKKIFELFISLIKETTVSEHGGMILAERPSQLEFRKAFLEQLIKFSELTQYVPHIEESLTNSESNINGNYLKILRKLLGDASSNKVSNYFIGSNLSVFCSLLGTAYMPDLKGKVLFLEECNEPLYKMERMFYQLHLAGCFKDLEELWIGTSLNAELPMGLLESFSAIYNFRLVTDLPIGHGDLNFITPLF
jgi:muramoyltetrapeptide carboxypeptidase LdcA involved in peptidoglycan recycling